MRSAFGSYRTETPLHLEGHRAMFEPFRLSATDHLVNDRIHELHEVAAGLHVGPRPPRTAGGLTNPVARARALIGRRLISLGSTVAGQQA